MPKISRNAQEESNDTNLEKAIEQTLASIAITTDPVKICGVNRRINLGNYEHIDIYSGIVLPMPNATVEDIEQLKRIVAETAELGFNITSSETYHRYMLIKDNQGAEEVQT